jgi:tRNA G18 (ribose-2'-O)-methylase SpoU
MGARLIPVSDLNLPELVPYRDLRDRDLAALGELGADPTGPHAGGFIAEGDVVVRVLARSPFQIASVLVSESRLSALAPLFETMPETPVYVAPQAAMDVLVGFPIHRGLLALGVRAPRDPDVLLQDDGLVLALVGLTNHDNVGGIFRNAAAFGIRAVLLDDTTCDPLYRKALRVSVGGALLVPFARAGSGDALVTRLLGHGYEPLALTPRGAHTLESLAPHPRRALILGTEGPGLPDDLMARTRGVRIDMAAGFDSLNVYVTSGIALYALTRGR